MRLDDNCAPERQTVSAMDILAPGIGEIVGGSQREERLEKLEQKDERHAHPGRRNELVPRYTEILVLVRMPASDLVSSASCSLLRAWAISGM